MRPSSGPNSGPSIRIQPFGRTCQSQLMTVPSPGGKGQCSGGSIIELVVREPSLRGRLNLVSSTSIGVPAQARAGLRGVQVQDEVGRRDVRQRQRRRSVPQASASRAGLSGRTDEDWQRDRKSHHDSGASGEPFEHGQPFESGSGESHQALYSPGAQPHANGTCRQRKDTRTRP
jgi:hypothetical protein